jgi:hypothetical protein
MQNQFEFGGPDYHHQEDQEITQEKRLRCIKVHGYSAGPITFLTTSQEISSHTKEVMNLPSYLKETFNEKIKHLSISTRAAVTAMIAVEQSANQISSCSRKCFTHPACDQPSKTRTYFPVPGDRDGYVGVKRPSVDPHHNLLNLLAFSSKIGQDYKIQSDVVLLFASGGMVAYGPASSQVGDIVCRFKDTEIVAILRKVGERYEMLGRAVDIGVSRVKRRLLESWSLDFDIDVRGLQLLTWIPHNDWGIISQLNI